MSAQEFLKAALTNEMKERQNQKLKIIELTSNIFKLKEENVKCQRELSNFKTIELQNFQTQIQNQKDKYDQQRTSQEHKYQNQLTELTDTYNTQKMDFRQNLIEFKIQKDKDVEAFNIQIQKANQVNQQNGNQKIEFRQSLIKFKMEKEIKIRMLQAQVKNLNCEREKFQIDEMFKSTLRNEKLDKEFKEKSKIKDKELEDKIKILVKTIQTQTIRIKNLIKINGKNISNIHILQSQIDEYQSSNKAKQSQSSQLQNIMVDSKPKSIKLAVKRGVLIQDNTVYKFDVKPLKKPKQQIDSPIAQNIYVEPKEKLVDPKQKQIKLAVQKGILNQDSAIYKFEIKPTRRQKQQIDAVKSLKKLRIQNNIGQIQITSRYKKVKETFKSFTEPDTFFAARTSKSQLRSESTADKQDTRFRNSEHVISKPLEKISERAKKQKRMKLSHLIINSDYLMGEKYQSSKKEKQLMKLNALLNLSSSTLMSKSSQSKSLQSRQSQRSHPQRPQVSVNYSYRNLNRDIPVSFEGHTFPDLSNAEPTQQTKNECKRYKSPTNMIQLVNIGQNSGIVQINQYNSYTGPSRKFYDCE